MRAQRTDASRALCSALCFRSSTTSDARCPRQVAARWHRPGMSLRLAARRSRRSCRSGRPGGFDDTRRTALLTPRWIQRNAGTGSVSLGLRRHAAEPRVSSRVELLEHEHRESAVRVRSRRLARLDVWPDRGLVSASPAASVRARAAADTHAAGLSSWTCLTISRNCRTEAQHSRGLTSLLAMPLPAMRRRMWRSSTLHLTRPSGRSLLPSAPAVDSTSQQHLSLPCAPARPVWPTTLRAKPLSAAPARGRQTQRRGHRRNAPSRSHFLLRTETRARSSSMSTAASLGEHGSPVGTPRTGMPGRTRRTHAPFPAVPAADRAQRRAQLTDVIRRVLRSTPALCYYQVSAGVSSCCAVPADSAPRDTTT
jgi:hypothetical protein